MPIEGSASTILTSYRGRIAVTTVILFLVLTGFASGAGAQNIPPSFRDIQRVVNPRLAVERAYRLRTAVNRAAGRSETGGFRLSLRGVTVTSVEGIPNDTLKDLKQRPGT